MSVRRLIWLLACAALAGCASEGGVTGTGVSAISGNIVLVSAESAGPTGLTLPFPIRVTIAEFPGIAGTTDSAGTFQLNGAFSGALTLEFTNAADGAEIGPLPLEVPAGSQTVLENIEIHTAAPPPDRVQPAAVRLFDVFGRVDLVECNADGTGTLLVTDDGGRSRQFMMSLTADTDVIAADGGALTCADIRLHGAVRVEGFLRSADQTIVALRVVVSSRRPSPPGPGPRAERARGVVDAVSCDRGVVVFDQRGIPDPVQRVIRLTDHTELRCGVDVPAPCDCAAIAIGAPIGVIGTILPAQPGQIQAEVVFLGAATVSVDVTGTITSLACAIGALAITDGPGGPGARIALIPETEIICPAGMCRCADLRLRQRVRVEGEQPADGGPITAGRITVLAGR